MKTTYFKTTVVLLLSIFVSYCSTRQTPLIIDTDAGIDDFRALCLLFASPSFTIKAIITSDGNVDPCIGALKVRNLAISLHKDSLPIGFGKQAWQNFPGGENSPRVFLGGFKPLWRGV